MDAKLNSEALSVKGATAVITHRVHSDNHTDYEDWINEIAPHCRSSAGSLDWHIVRPIKGQTQTFTIIVRFDTSQNLRRWMESKTRASLIQKVQPLLVVGDNYSISSGLDFLFPDDTATTKSPKKWKQFLTTWSAIYPIVLLTPLVVLPILRLIGIGQNYYIDMLIVTGSIVFLMVYLIMPRYTNLIRHWLFK